MGDARENVLQQLRNLRGYPFLRDIRSYGWYIDIGEATVYAYDERKKKFAQIRGSAIS